jgi:CBS domain-containing protein
MILSFLVRDVMVKSVAYAAIPGNRDDVLKTLQDRKVSGLPVVKKGEVVGMITRTDLLRNREEDQTALLMTRDPVVISPEKSIVEASELLVRHGIRRLPVVECNELVGMLTVADIIRVAEEMKITESIEPYLEKETVVLWSEMPLTVAGSIMEYAAAEACPVIDSDLKLVGMISDRDLIKASVIEESVEKTDMSADDGEDTWMWDRVMQTINKYYTVSRIRLRNIPVREAMVPPKTAFKKDEVSECAAIMRKNRIDQMPVVTSSQKLMGMLKDTDILRALVDYCKKTTA